MRREGAQAAAARSAAAWASNSLEQGLTQARPVLTMASLFLGGVGRVLIGASLVGAIGAAGIAVLGLISFGPIGLLFALCALIPWAGWRVGARARRGAGLLGDPHRVLAAVLATGQAGHDWLDHMASLGEAAKGRQPRAMIKAAVGAGRSVWRAVGPEVEGAAELKALCLWPRTVAMAVAAGLSTLLLPIAMTWTLFILVY